MFNPLVLFPCFFDLENAPNNPNNSIVLGKPGKGIKTNFFKECNFKPELAPKNAKVKRIKINEENLVVMTY
ncbi:hypothetical protein [Bacillus cereus]|uniref:hypothetical protein n=1 Tax=Bacillus cereus group TaxID=86661 RepID=UPI0024075093|nr:hypothetical protein [Bacillus cereus]MDF9530621.1 hypothetical protein [Bacillus cereus]MDG1578895.1 hypothetical protein [Bacillus cereus]